MSDNVSVNMPQASEKNTLVIQKHPVHEELAGYEGAKFGMWLFLATELLLFAVLFAFFAIFHVKFLEAFQMAHNTLDKTLGGANTVILILSSMSVALSLDAIQRGKRKLCSVLLVITVILAGSFLVVKYFEYTAKFNHQIYPGSVANLKDKESGKYVSVNEWSKKEGWSESKKIEMQNGINLYFAMYFVMTGIHGLHIIIGMLILLGILIYNNKGRYNHWYYTPVENGALYWHLVDLIWIFLFPLLYLIQ